jgi:hypothetical protein
VGAPWRAGTVALNRFLDDRGSLVVAELGQALPFDIARFFVISGVPRGASRGEHAHRRCEQFLVCLSGSVVAEVDDGTSRQEVILDRSDLGLYMPAMTWGTQHTYSADAILLVLASRRYEVEDYIDDYDEFLALTYTSRGGDY